MIIKKNSLMLFLLFSSLQTCYSSNISEQFKHTGYVEFYDQNHTATTFDILYQRFDELIDFLHANPAWTRKLYCAKERFIRSEQRNYYCTDFFGFYDESQKTGRNQIAFYYSAHFHEFIISGYPEFNQALPIIHFLQLCFQIQKDYEMIFQQTAHDLQISSIFSATNNHPPILFKVVKYFPAYTASKPHYDGTAFSLFLDSTDHQSLLLAPYKSTLTVDDFSTPIRQLSRCDYQNSILLIPGTLLKEFEIYPTPHIVTRSGKTRYATIAFAMRPDYVNQKNEFSMLPSFKY